MGSGMHKFLTDFVQTDGFIQSEYGKFIAVGLVADIANKAVPSIVGGIQNRPLRTFVFQFYK